MLLPMVWTLKGTKPAGMPGSENLPAKVVAVTLVQLELNTWMLPLVEFEVRRVDVGGTAGTSSRGLGEAGIAGAGGGGFDLRDGACACIPGRDCAVEVVEDEARRGGTYEKCSGAGGVEDRAGGAGRRSGAAGDCDN